MPLLPAVMAAPAQAKLVYVKNPAFVAPVVYVADDDGGNPRRLGTGRAPTISPDGNWVAFVTVPTGAGQLDTVVLQKLSGGGSQRFVMRSKVIDSLRFSPDSKLVGAIAASERVRIYDIAKDVTKVAAEGDIRGYGFSPDSTEVVYGEAESDKFGAPSDLFIGDAHGRFNTDHARVKPPSGDRPDSTRPRVLPEDGQTARETALRHERSRSGRAGTRRA